MTTPRTCLLLAICALLTPVAAMTAELQLEGYDAFASEALRIVGTPGAAIAVVQGDRSIARGYGVRVAGQPQRVDADTIFAIASNTKLFTGTAAALLHHEGVLSLDASLTTYVPTLRFADPYVTRHATGIDALAHRTGLATINMGWLLNPQASTEQILAQVAHVPLAQTFRNGWNYSNYMYAAVGAAIEASSGDSWGKVVEERMFRPLGMTRSSTRLSALDGMDNVASPHAVLRGVTRAIPFHNIDNIGPAGSINSTASDMARWCRLQAGLGTVDGRKIIDATVIEKTRQPYAVRPLETSDDFRTGRRYVSYGLGVGRRDYRNNYTLLSHTGGIDGMFSATMIVPEAQLCVAVMTNRSSGRGLELIMAHRLLEQVLAVPDATDWLARLKNNVREAGEREQRAAKELERGRNSKARPTHRMEDYVGTYSHALGDVSVTQTGNSLRLTAGLKSGQLDHWRYDTYTIDWEGESPVPQRVTFHLDQNGDVDRLSAAFDDAPVEFLRQRDAPATTRAVP